MATSIVLPHDESEPMRLEGLESLQELQNAVGGAIEAVTVQQPPMTLFLNEDGKALGLPVNLRASLLWWLFVPDARHRDVLCGNVVIVGPPDRAGRSTDAPEEMQRLLFEARLFKIEVQTLDDPEAWNGNSQIYDSFFEATASGLSLANRWTAVERVRVAIAD